MPVTKSAIKKLRQDRKRQKQNTLIKDTLKDLLKQVRKNPSDERIRKTVQAFDKAAKKHLVPKNKVARIKSSLAKLGVKKEPQTAPKVTKKRTAPRKASVRT